MIFFLILVIWLYGFVMLLQIELYEQVFIYSAHLKMLLLISLLVWYFVRNAWHLNKVNTNFIDLSNTKKIYSLWIIYILFDFFFLLIATPHDLEFLIFSFNVMYFYPLALIFVWDYQARRNRFYKRYMLLFFVFFMPVLLLGIFQGVSNDLFLPQYFIDFRSIKHIEFVEGGVKALSIFGSGWAFGEYLIYGFCIIYLLLQKSKFKALYFLLMFLTLVTIFYTLSRTTYIQLIIVVLGLFLLTKSKVSGNTMVAISIFTAISLHGLTYLIVNYVGVSSGGILNTESLEFRIAHWSNSIDLLVDTGNIWLGSGIIANDRYDITKGLLVDNVYFAYMLHSGVIGLLLIFIFFFVFLKRIINYARESKDVVWLGLSAYLFGVPAGGVLTDQHNVPFLLILLSFFFSPIGSFSFKERLNPKEKAQNVKS